MVEIKWTDNALQEIDGIAEYISKDSPKFIGRNLFSTDNELINMLVAIILALINS